MIPYGRQHIDNDDIEAVIAALRSDYLTQGPAVPAFEKAITDYVGAKHGVAVNSATSALHIACLALGVGPSDHVWTSPITFVASANCAIYCGATIDFVDINPITYNLCPNQLEKKLANAKKTNTLPKVVIPVHFSGQPCDMRAIHDLSKLYGFRILEDASHAIGSKYYATTIGDCSYSDITVFSFHPVKIITTGEGGIATTNSSELFRKMQLFRSHGITRETTELNSKSEGAWYYEQQMLGFNYRMTDLQAALGLSQLKHLDSWITKRHDIADKYDSQLKAIPVTTPCRTSDALSSLHLYPILVNDRKRVFDQLRRAGIGVNVHYIPVYRQPYYASAFHPANFPAAESYYDRALSLPMFPGLDQNEHLYTIETLRKLVT
jgi:UDP-4-amino-4,6-dideoxy-N-acetyl-beta-L-altrosamine transaminase